MAAPLEPAPHPGPFSIFVACAQVALRSFGGAAPWARRVFVEERGWLSEREFADELGVGQLLPGPNVVNLAVRLGDRLAGAPGALAALLGLVALPTLLVVSLTSVLLRFLHLPLVRAALVGLAAGSAGLVWHLGLRLLRGHAARVGDALLVLATFVAVGPLHLPLVWVLAAALPASLLVHWGRA